MAANSSSLSHNYFINFHFHWSRSKFLIYRWSIHREILLLNLSQGPIKRTLAGSIQSFELELSVLKEKCQKLLAEKWISDLLFYEFQLCKLYLSRNEFIETVVKFCSTCSPMTTTRPPRRQKRGDVPTHRCRVKTECKVWLQNDKPQQRRIIVRTRDLPPVALLLSQRAAKVAMVTDRRKPEPTLPFPRMQAPDVSLSCVKWFSCTVLQLLLLLLVLLFFFFSLSLSLSLFLNSSFTVSRILFGFLLPKVWNARVTMDSRVLSLRSFSSIINSSYQSSE